MTIAVAQEVVNSDNTTTSSGSSISVTITPSAGSILHVFGSGSGTAGNGSNAQLVLSDSLGQTYTALSLVNENSRHARDWYLLRCLGLATTITLSFSENCIVKGIIVREITGGSAFQVKAGQGQFTPGTGTDAITTGNMTPTTQPALVSSFCYDSVAEGTANAGPVVGTGYTLGTTGWNFGESGNPPPPGTNAMTSEYQRITSTAALAATYTSANGATGRFKTVAAIFTEGAGTVGFSGPWLTR